MGGGFKRQMLEMACFTATTSTTTKQMIGLARLCVNSEVPGNRNLLALPQKNQSENRLIRNPTAAWVASCYCCLQEDPTPSTLSSGRSPIPARSWVL